jgi:hypothetical protein
MNQEEWVLVDTCAGQLQAELVRGLLEAQGIQVWLNQAGAAHAYAVTVGSIGRVEVLVPSGDKDQAEHILDEYYSGSLDGMDLQGIENIPPVEDSGLAEDSETEEI